jgi:cytochrome P450
MQADAGFVQEKLSAWEHRFVRRVYSVFKLPDSWPTPDAVRTRAGVAAVDELIHRVIAKAENDPPKERNLLVRLLEMRRDEPEAFSAQQLRDELMTLMLAGHDTTAVALTWTCWLLARHPEIQQQAADEIHAALRGASPTAADVEKMPLTCRILDESMRLYPPVPGISRQPIEDDVVTGVLVAAGGRVEFSLFATHRHPAFWTEPERFDPRRFEDDRRVQIDAFAYLPFSRGPRLCVGKDLALLEMPLLLAQILQAFRLETLTDEEPEPFAAITLRPKNGMPLRITPRRSA